MSQPADPEVFIELGDSSTTEPLLVLRGRVDGNAIKRCSLV